MSPMCVWVLHGKQQYQHATVCCVCLGCRYVVERMEPALWAKVLVEENEYRRQLIDQASLLFCSF